MLKHNTMKNISKYKSSRRRARKSQKNKLEITRTKRYIIVNTNS